MTGLVFRESVNHTGKWMVEAEGHHEVVMRFIDWLVEQGVPVGDTYWAYGDRMVPRNFDGGWRGMTFAKKAIWYHPDEVLLTLARIKWAA